MKLNAKIVVGLLACIGTGVAVSMYFSGTEEPQAATAMERCVEKHIKAVPEYQRARAAIEFAQICKYELGT